MAAIPRGEYPRPQLRRERWRCLNGEWEFAFDDADAGVREWWWERERLEGRVTVPFPYQARLSGIGDRAVHPVLWYRRTFAVPPEWEEQRVLLHFGAVDYRADVWVDGVHAGAHEGGYTPFGIDVTAALRTGLAGQGQQGGEQTLVVRCEDLPSGEQPCGKQDREAHRAYCFAATSGIWQTVWLEPVGAVAIDACRILADVAGGAFRVGVRLAARGSGAPAGGLRLEVRASFEGRPVGEGEVELPAVVGSGSDTSGRQDVVGDAGEAGEADVGDVLDGVDWPGAVVTLEERHPWTPETPSLYDLELHLRDGSGQLLDVVTAYAGLREVVVRGREVLLNGQPVYQRQVLDQGYWPDGIYTAPDDAALRADVEWTKRLGFNGVRKHQKVEDPRWLYWCDRLGLLVWAEMATFWTDTPQARARLRREWAEVVRRDRNHPSVVTWVPFNESMGLREVDSDPDVQGFIRTVARDTRRLDPTRPVVDNSGWSHVDTDIADSHHYEPAGELFLTGWHAFHAGGGQSGTWGERLRSWDGHHQGRRWYGPGYPKRLFVMGAAYGGQPILASEWGGFFLEGAGTVAPILRERRGVEADEAAFLARYGDMVVAFDSLPELAGDCWTQLTDIEDEPNGLLTEERRAKVDVAAIGRINTARSARSERSARTRERRRRGR